jgi:hypothetical protein
MQIDVFNKAAKISTLFHKWKDTDVELSKNADNEIICEALNKQLKEIESELEEIMKKLFL